MEPYNDVDPGETDIPYSRESDIQRTNANDTIWNEHSVSIK